MNPFVYLLIIMALLWSVVICVMTGKPLAAVFALVALVGWIRAAEIDTNLSERFKP